MKEKDQVKIKNFIKSIIKLSENQKEIELGYDKEKYEPIIGKKIELNIPLEVLEYFKEIVKN